MKKLISVFLMFAMILSFSACGTAKPEDTVKSYLSAAKKFDTEEMTKYVLETNSATDETTTVADEDEDEGEDDAFLDFFEAYMKDNASKLTYKTSNSEVDGENAVVTVEIKYVDGSALIKAVMGVYMQQMFASAFSNEKTSDEKTNAMMSEIMKEEMNKTAETFKEVALKINCVLKNKTWYIEEVSDELSNVLSSGFFNTMTEIGDGFSGFESDS